MRRAGVTWAAWVLAVAAAAPGCGGHDPEDGGVVVVYTSLDQVHSEPILDEFERRTGIRVLPVYDAEASKTTGLVNRLIARRNDPDCDVLWNNEVVQTARLASMGLLAPYASPNASRIPAEFRDVEHRWTGFAARMRVIIYNTGLVAAEEAPDSLADLTDEKWKGRAALARPFFGTTLTHMAWLHQAWGGERLSKFCRAVRANDVAFCTGNATVRDMVAAGERAFGLTDTDDAWAAMQAGKPVGVRVPDAAAGAVVMPNTVSLVSGCPHPEAGRRLIDYLLSAEVERRLARGAGAQIPLGTDLAAEPTPWDVFRRGPAMGVDVAKAASSIPEVVALLRQAGMDE